MTQLQTDVSVMQCLAVVCFMLLHLKLFRWLISILQITTQSSLWQTRHTPASVALHTYNNVFSSLCHTTPCMHAHRVGEAAGCVIKGRILVLDKLEVPQEGREAGSVDEQTCMSRDTGAGCPVAGVAPSARVQCGCVVCAGWMQGNDWPQLLSLFVCARTNAKQSEAMDAALPG